MSFEFSYFTESGRAAWSDWLDTLKLDPSSPLPEMLLEDDASVETITVESPPPSGPFPTKYEFAKQLAPFVDSLEEKSLRDSDWPGVWDALAMRYFDEICPTRENGSRDVKQLARYRLEDDFRTRYRHRIYGPMILYKTENDASPVILETAPSIVSDSEEQIGSRLEFASNPSVLRSIFALYWNPKENRSKSGWAANSPKPGTLRRFVAVLFQLGRTYDLYSMETDCMLELLPEEFERYRSS